MFRALKWYLLSILLIAIYIIIEMSSINQIEISRLILLCGSCLFMYIGGYKLSNEVNSNIPMKINLWIFFIIYLVLLITLTLFDPIWGRHGINNVIDTDSFSYYIDNAFNYIPFKTINIYIRNLSYNVISKQNIMFNLVGNFVCMMPFALFLPLLFKSENKFKVFLETVLCITMSIEVVQFITTSGTCDIDDIILNAGGAVLLYLFISIKPIKRCLFKVFLKEEI